MKVVEITKEFDQAVTAIIDAALKQGGWAMMQPVDVVRAAMLGAKNAAADPNPNIVNGQAQNP